MNQDPGAQNQLGQPTPPTMQEAPPDPFGGIVQAIALGFAAGFGGKSVQDQIAESRRQSWEAWMRKQDLALRREELDRNDRRFAMSLDMQRTQLEYEKSRDERAAQERATSEQAAAKRFDDKFAFEKGQADKADKLQTMEQAGLAQLGVDQGILPPGALFATPGMLDAAGRAQARQADESRFQTERLDRQNFQAQATKADQDKLAFEVWKTLRAEDNDVKQLDSQFRAQAVALAREDLTAGRTNSFEGSIEAYLKLFGRANTAAKSGSEDLKSALDAIKGGDFSRLDEIRSAAPAAESRPAETSVAPPRATIKPLMSPASRAEMKRSEEARKSNETVSAAQSQAIKESFEAMASDRYGKGSAAKIEEIYRSERKMRRDDPISDADFYQWLRSEIGLEKDDSLTVDDLRERIAKLQYKQKPKK